MQYDEMTLKIIAKITSQTDKKISEFVELVKQKQLVKHGEIRSYFKSEFNLSYGYANSLAHIVRDQIEGKSSGEDLIDAQFLGKQHLRSIYDSLIHEISKFGNDVEFAPKKTYMSLRRKKQFGLLKPSTKKRFDIGLILKGYNYTNRLIDGKKWNSMCTHRISLSSVEDVDDQVIAWLKDAYRAAK